MASDDERGSKKRKRKEKRPTSRFENLPRDISLEILSRLPLRSLFRFMYSNRFCSQLSQDPSLLSRFKNDNPWLILSSTFLVKQGLYFAEIIGKNRAIVRKTGIPFCEVKLVASCNGMLCLSHYSGNIYIYNPFTKQCKELEKSNRIRSNYDMVLGFGYHPLANEYKVIRKLNLRTKEKYISIHTVGKNERTSIVEAPPQLRPQSPRALVNGRLHWFTIPLSSSKEAKFDQKIISFDLLDEHFRDILIPVHGIKGEYSSHLTVLGDFLSIVFSYPNVSARSFRSRKNFARSLRSKNVDANFEIWAMFEYEVFESWTCLLRVDVSSLSLGSRSRQSLELDKVICLLKNRRILVLYKGGILVAHDLDSGEYAKLVVKGNPHTFQAWAHIGSLNWIDTPDLTC